MMTPYFKGFLVVCSVIITEHRGHKLSLGQADVHPFVFVVGPTVSTVIREVSVKVCSLVSEVSVAVVSGRGPWLSVLTVTEQLALAMSSWPNYIPVCLDENSPNQARWNSDVKAQQFRVGGPALDDLPLPPSGIVRWRQVEADLAGRTAAEVIAVLLREFPRPARAAY